jgi:hypothetical protein
VREREGGFQTGGDPLTMTIRSRLLLRVHHTYSIAWQEGVLRRGAAAKAESRPLRHLRIGFQ